MKAFFKELENKIQEAVTADVKEVLKEVGGEKIYAAALVTDSDCITLYLAVNTYEYMKKRDLEYIDILHLPEDQARKIQDGTGSIVKWVPVEWGYSDGKGSRLNDISKLLYAKEASDSESYEKEKDLFFETVTSAFKKVIDSKIFGEASEEIVYLISMSDDERAEDIEDYSAKLLNSEEVYEKFVKCRETEGIM